MIESRTNSKTVRKDVPGLTAILDEKGVTVYWKGTKKVQCRPVIGEAGSADGLSYRRVYLPFELLSFGFTEADLNTCGWATAVEINPREPRFSNR